MLKENLKGQTSTVIDVSNLIIGFKCPTFLKALIAPSSDAAVSMLRSSNMSKLTTPIQEKRLYKC